MPILTTIETLRPAREPEPTRFVCPVCGARYRTANGAALHSTTHDAPPLDPPT